MARLIDVEEVCKEIDRFKGYLDEDMICRLKIAVKRLSTVEAIPVDWIKRYLKTYPSLEIFISIMLMDWREENEQH